VLPSPNRQLLVPPNPTLRPVPLSLPIRSRRSLVLARLVLARLVLARLALVQPVPVLQLVPLDCALLGCLGQAVGDTRSTR
jgi:hypothetical protein